MVIVKILGGFASQLGKFIWTYNLAKEKNDDFAIDISEYVDGYFRPFVLHYLSLPDANIVVDAEKIPGIKVAENSKDLERYYLGDESYNKILITKEEVSYIDFCESHGHLFINTNSDILKTLQLKEKSKFLESFGDYTNKNDCVAVHIRRGDFVSLNINEDEMILKKYVNHFYNKYPLVKIVFFSNDIPWVKRTFGGDERFIYIENTNGIVGDLEEFFAISKCKYRLLSSFSGFSLYASLLGKAIDHQSHNIVVKKNDNIIVAYKDSDRFWDVVGGDDIDKDYLICNRIEDNINYNLPVTSHNELIIEHTDNDKDCEHHIFFDNNKIKESEGKSYIIITMENNDYWKIKGMKSVAHLIAKFGGEVLYISVGRGVGMGDVCDTEAKNPDGIRLGFKNIVINIDDFNEDIIKDRCRVNTIVVSEIPLKYRSYYKYYYLRRLDYSIMRRIKLVVQLIIRGRLSIVDLFSLKGKINANFDNNYQSVFDKNQYKLSSITSNDIKKACWNEACRIIDTIL